MKCISIVPLIQRQLATYFNIELYVHTVNPLYNAVVEVTQYFNPQTQSWVDVCDTVLTSYLCTQKYYTDPTGKAYLCLPQGQFILYITYQGYYINQPINVTGNEYFDIPFYFVNKE